MGNGFEEAYGGKPRRIRRTRQHERIRRPKRIRRHEIPPNNTLTSVPTCGIIK